METFSQYYGIFQDRLNLNNDMFLSLLRNESALKSHFTMFEKYFEGFSEVLLTFVLILSSSDVAFHQSQT